VTPLWDVIGKRWMGYALSALLIIPGLVALITNAGAGRGALNWGVDFTGGSYFQTRLGRDASVAEVRAVVDRFAAGQSIIQKSDSEIFIRTRPLSPDDRRGLLDALRREFGGLTLLREDEVGPTIGEELRNAAILGILLGLVLQLIYITYRFKSVRYAVAADAALLHDMLIVIGVFALTRREVNGSFVAVLLTILGYSINDKIVLYDRIRENLAMRTREAFDQLVNRSLLESLIRSLNTSITVVFAIAAVWVFGGVTVKDLAFGLTVGVIISTYSSVFTAGALLVDWHLITQRRAGRADAEPAGRPKALATEAAGAGPAPDGDRTPVAPPRREAQGRATAKRRRNRRR
jgi:preprotein translocase subunit SecF